MMEGHIMFGHSEQRTTLSDLIRLIDGEIAVQCSGVAILHVNYE